MPTKKLKQIAIVGCGWLGFSLAKELLADGYRVKASVTNKNKLSVLKKAKITPYIIQLLPNKTLGNYTDFLHTTQVVLISIPPKTKNGISFKDKITTFLTHTKNTSIEKIIFISATSVYANTFPITTITENSIPNPETENGKQLLAAETEIMATKKGVIIRFGGLIDENRHPIHYLAGKNNVKNPNAPINLIHKKDCIALIKNIIATDIKNVIFNGVFPKHTSRKEYYTQKALELELSLPQFSSEKPCEGKKIVPKNVTDLLSFTYTTSV